MDQRVLVIIPAFNESRSITQTIQSVLNQSIEVDIVVINDGSTDDTVEQARSFGVPIISLPFNLGIGGAVQTGFKYALEQEYDIAIQVDGDNQHDVNFIKDLIAPLLNKTSDMIIGSRFIPPYVGYRSSFVRRIGINFFARLISLITKSAITDPTSGFRAYNKDMIRIFAHYYPYDYPEPEAIVVAKRCQKKVSEVPVTMRERTTGISSIRYLKTLYYMIKVTFAILLVKLKKKKDFISDDN